MPNNEQANERLLPEGAQLTEEEMVLVKATHLEGIDLEAAITFTAAVKGYEYGKAESIANKDKRIAELEVELAEVYRLRKGAAEKGVQWAHEAEVAEAQVKTLRDALVAITSHAGTAEQHQATAWQALEATEGETKRE